MIFSLAKPLAMSPPMILAAVLPEPIKAMDGFDTEKVLKGSNVAGVYQKQHRLCALPKDIGAYSDKGAAMLDSRLHICGHAHGQGIKCWMRLL